MVKQFTLFLFFIGFLPSVIFSQKKTDIIDIERQQYASLIQMEAAAAANTNGSNIDERVIIRH